METLDDIVVAAVTEQILVPERVKDPLQAWLDSSETSNGELQAELKRLKSRLTNLDGESANVIKLLSQGICNPDDPQIASELGNILAQKAAVNADIELMQREVADKHRHSASYSSEIQ